MVSIKIFALLVAVLFLCYIAPAVNGARVTRDIKEDTQDFIGKTKELFDDAVSKINIDDIQKGIKDQVEKITQQVKSFGDSVVNKKE